MPVTLSELLEGSNARLEDMSEDELLDLNVQIRQQRRGIRTPAPKTQRTAKAKPVASAIDKQALLAFIEKQTKLLKGAPDA